VNLGADTNDFEVVEMIDWQGASYKVGTEDIYDQSASNFFDY